MAALSEVARNAPRTGLSGSMRRGAVCRGRLSTVATMRRTSCSGITESANALRPISPASDSRIIESLFSSEGSEGALACAASSSGWRTAGSGAGGGGAAAAVGAGASGAVGEPRSKERPPRDCTTYQAIAAATTSPMASVGSQNSAPRCGRTYGRSSSRADQGSTACSLAQRLLRSA